MQASSGRTSPSFIVAVAVVLLAVGGYVAWQMRSGGSHGASDEIVRDFVSAVGRDTAEYRRSLGAAVALERPTAESLQAAIAKVDAAAADVSAKVEAQAETTRGRLEALEDLPVRTLRNRLARIDKRLQESKDFIAELAKSTKERLGQPSAKSGADG